MEKAVYESTKGFSAGVVIAVVIGLIFILALAVPIASDLVANANLTGTSAVIAGLLPLLLIVGTVILVTKMYN
jgi:hypothetical protein